MRGTGSESNLSNRGNVIESDKRPKGRHPAVIKDFDSVAQLLSFIDRTPPLWKPLDGRHITEVVYAKPANIEFYGAATWPEAKVLASKGWPEGRKMLIQAAHSHLMAGRESSRAMTYDVAGAIPDVPRFLAGDPDCMIDWQPADHGRQRAIKLSVSPICDRSVSQQHRANWGAALLSWIEAQETAGYSIEIGAIFVTTTTLFGADDLMSGPPIVVRFKLKRADDFFDLSQLAFWLMHNAAHRRVQFAIRERLPVGFWYSEGDAIYGRAVINRDDVGQFCDPETILLVLGEGATSVSQGIKQIEKTVAEWQNGRSPVIER